MADIFEALARLGNLVQKGGRVCDKMGMPILTFAPLLVFRFEPPLPRTADKIAKCVKEFPGELEWHFNASGPGINWVLGPERLWRVADVQRLQGAKAARDLIREQDPDFGIRANAELDRLADFFVGKLQTE